MKNKFTPLFEMAHEIRASDSQVDNVQMFKVDIIYHRYAHIRIKLQGVGMEADMGHFIYCILCFHSRVVGKSDKAAEFD